MSDDTVDHVQDIVEPVISRDFLSLTESVNELKTLLSKQTEVLIAIGERQAAAGIKSRFLLVNYGVCLTTFRRHLVTRNPSSTCEKCEFLERVTSFSIRPHRATC
jgi:hypothetical protein